MNRPCACKKVSRIIYKVYDLTGLWKISFFFSNASAHFFLGTTQCKGDTFSKIP